MRLAPRSLALSIAVSVGGCGSTSKGTQPASAEKPVARKARGDGDSGTNRDHIERRALPILAGYPCRSGEETEEKNAAERANLVLGHLDAEVIQKVVQDRYDVFRKCYEDGLGRKGDLQGSTSIKFVIDRDGSVKNARPTCVTLADPAVVQCITAGIAGLVFPRPKGGVVTVSYPMVLSPEE